MNNFTLFLLVCCIAVVQCETNNHTSCDLSCWLESFVLTLPDISVILSSENTTTTVTTATTTTTTTLVLSNITCHSLYIDSITSSTTNVPSLSVGINGLGIQHCTLTYSIIESDTTYENITDTGETSAAVADSSVSLSVSFHFDNNKLPIGINVPECDTDVQISELIIDDQSLSRLIIRTLENALSRFICTKLETILGETLSDTIYNLTSNTLQPLFDYVPPPAPTLPLELYPLSNSSFFDSIAYLLNIFVGTDGTLGLNVIFDTITNDTGILNIPLNLSIPFEVKNIGVLTLEIFELSLSGLDTWKYFNILEPIDFSNLYFFLELEETLISIDFSLNVSLFQNSTILQNNQWLYEEAEILFALNTTQFSTNLQLAINSTLLKNLNNWELQNLECLLSTIVLNSSSITDFMIDYVFSRFAIYPTTGETDSLETDLDELLTRIVLVFADTMGDVIPLLFTGFLNGPVLNTTNEILDNAFSGKVCEVSDYVAPPVFNLLASVIPSVGAIISFGLLLLIFFCTRSKCEPRIESNRKCDSDLLSSEDNNPSESEDSYLLERPGSPPYVTPCSSPSPVRLKESHFVGSIVPSASPSLPAQKPLSLDSQYRYNPNYDSLLFHPKLPLFWRILTAFLFLTTFGVFICTHTSIGAIYSFEFSFGSPFNRTISTPSLFDFTLANPVNHMWNNQVYLTAFMIVAFSGFWPYFRLASMFFCFILPTRFLSAKNREIILIFFNSTGKWTILQAYISVIVMVAFKFNLVFPSFSSTNYPSVIDFAVSPMEGFPAFLGIIFVSVLMGHLLVELHRHACFPTLRLFVQGISPLFMTIQGNIIRVLLSIFLVLATGFLGAGMFITSLDFQYTGGMGWFMEELGTNSQTYHSFLSFGLTIPPSTFDTSDYKIIMIQITFLSTVVFIPLVQSIVMLFVWFFPLHYKLHLLLYRAIEVLFAWNTLDVFVVAMLGSSFKLGVFADFVIGDKCDRLDILLSDWFYDVLDGNTSCLDLQASLHTGFILLVVGLVFYICSTVLLMRVLFFYRGSGLPRQQQKLSIQRKNQESSNPWT